MSARDSLFADRRQRRIREQLRDAVDDVREVDYPLERDKRRISIRQFLVIDEVEALLEYVEELERRMERVRNEAPDYIKSLVRDA